MAGYERIYWEDEPSTNTPISAENLNKMDLGIANCAAEGAENTQAIETLEARVDEIIALPDGSTTADAELVDIRVGADGTSHASAGAAVREQVSDLKADLLQIEDDIYTKVESKNLIDPSKIVVGILGSNGNINEAMTGYKTSDFILLDVGSYVFAREKLSDGSALATGYAGYGFYDLNKTWVANSRVYDNWQAGTVLAITITSKCYIRVTGAENYFADDTTGLYILQKGTALDGYEAYFEPYSVVIALTENDVAQTSGQNVDKVMSQKAVTDYVDNHMPAELEDIADAFYTVVGKNKYNPTVCNPENGKYYNLTTGVSASAANYAITGKIPVEAETRYIFSAGSAYVFTAQFYSGETGDTFISATDNLSGGSFVTPQNCTFVGINLFATSHTTEQYNAAIAASQLELGSVATTYEPYTETVTLSDENIENGSSLSAISELTEKKSLINLYDKTLSENGKYVNTSHTMSTNADWAWTGKIPVVPNTQYCITQSGSAPVPFTTALDEWGQDGSWINTQTPSGAYSYEIPFITGPNTYFISCNMTLISHTAQNFEDTIDTIMLCLGTQRPLTYSPYNPVPAVLVDRLSDMYVANRECYTGKKWLATGTSITWYDSKKYQYGVHSGEICRGYIGNVARRKKLLVTNEGISGSTLGDVSASSLINRYTTLDWANTDIATIEYGVNDFGNAVAIGTENDAAGTTTFAACLKTVIEYALAQNPKIYLVICTEPDVRGDTANSAGHYLYEYTDVTLAIAKQYRLPVCDWFHHSGINSLTKGDTSHDYLTADGTHPNDAGHLRMGAMLNQVFDSLIC